VASHGGAYISEDALRARRRLGLEALVMLGFTCSVRDRYGLSLRALR
jgi:hypothetical protein